MYAIKDCWVAAQSHCAHVWNGVQTSFGNQPESTVVPISFTTGHGVMHERKHNSSPDK